MAMMVIVCLIVGTLLGTLFNGVADGIEILSKSSLETCEKTSASGSLNCSTKIVLSLAVPSGSSGGQDSIVGKIAEVNGNSSSNMQTLRDPPVITVNKSAVYALYDLTYIRDVPFKPEEHVHVTRKCEPDAGEKIVGNCVSLKDEKGNVLLETRPTCCPCGPQRRKPTSCGSDFDRIIYGKANTAHCLRFPGDWYHVFEIGQRSIGFSVRVKLEKGTRVSEVIIGPENKTSTTNDNSLKVNLIGDFDSYKNVPSFESFYLVIPREVGAPYGSPVNLGGQIFRWMVLERVRFTNDGKECNKIGVGYEAFNNQPDFCRVPYGSCLGLQLSDYLKADEGRIGNHQIPEYLLQGRFVRINQHPNAGPQSFSIGVTETLVSELKIELSADDIQYVVQRSPGEIINFVIPTFEAFSQFGEAKVTTKNTGDLEASYRITFNCSKGIHFVEEQVLTMKPKKTTTLSFKLSVENDQDAKYICIVILKDSQYNEVDRSECQFSATVTKLVTETFQNPKAPPKGFFESIRVWWKKLVNGFTDFITGDTCSHKCSSIFDLSCHVKYLCFVWLVLFAFFLALFLLVCVLIWLLHQKGYFDPFYYWYQDHFGSNHKRTNIEGNVHHHHHHENQPQDHHHHHHHHHHHNQPQHHIPHKRQKQHHHGKDEDVSYTDESHDSIQLHKAHKDSNKKKQRRDKHGMDALRV